MIAPFTVLKGSANPGAEVEVRALVARACEVERA